MKIINCFKIHIVLFTFALLGMTAITQAGLNQDPNLQFNKFDFRESTDAVNQPPVVFAGDDIAIASRCVQLNGGAMDDGLLQPLNIQWRVVNSSNPALVHIANPGQLDTLVCFDQSGVFELELVADDGRFLRADRIRIEIQVPPINQPPVVFAGEDIAIASRCVQLHGRVMDDGLLQPLILQWRVVNSSNPALIHIAHPERLDTVVCFDVPGVFEMELAANDGQFLRVDRIRIEIQVPIFNHAPQVNAGPDLIVIATPCVQLNGQVKDDGLIHPLIHVWHVVNSTGADLVHIQTPRQLDTLVCFDGPGFFELELFADDGEIVIRDRMRIQVQNAEQANIEIQAELKNETPQFNILLKGSLTKIKQGMNVTLNIRLSEAGTLDIELKDRKGHKVLFDNLGYFQAGDHSVQVNTSLLERGIYRAVLYVNGKGGEIFYISIN